jgi:uncharacterized protein (TIGR02246 family)
MEKVQSSPAARAFFDYTRAFQSGDPRGVAAHFNEPALMITPKGVYPLPDREAVEQLYGSIMAEMPDNYARTEFLRVDEQRLGDDLVAMSGSGTWVDTDGQRFMPFGMTYTLRRSDQGWRIVTAIIHSADVS